MAAGALVHRADVEAGRAADAGAAPGGRPCPRASRSGRCRAGPGGTPAARRRAWTPVHIDVYGFIRSAVDERGSSCRNTSRSCEGRHHLLDAHHRDQRLAAASGTSGRCPRTRRRTTVPVSATAKFAPETATVRAQELLAQVQRAPPRPARRGSSVSPSGAGRPQRCICSGRCRGSRCGCGGSPGPGCATAGRRRAARSARRGRSRTRVDAPRGQRLVQADLLRRHRLDLDDLGRARSPATRSPTIAFASARVARPSARRRRPR